MSSFILPIFPENSLAASVMTTVWVGVWVVALLNLRLGWTLSGLVVPGYLVPLLLIKPVSAGVIMGEAVLTYVIVGSISEYRSIKPWTSFFGRDRFLAMVLVSILVRCVMDGWVLPAVGDTLTMHYGWKLSFRDDLHSFGLIIVSLIANYFWKPGLKRGLLPLCVTIGLTYLIVRYGLAQWTNFSLGNLQYMYEEIATSLLASPKAYIVLITTAYLASQMNLHYGWEFNGILIPGLLALEWTEPFKIVTTFGEAFTVLVIASLLLKLPLFQRITMEGARKTLLFFNIAFALRLAAGHIAAIWLPDVKPTDLMGFGYLLSTLIATRLHTQGVWLRVPAVSLQVSLLGVVAGTLIGFVMMQTLDVVVASPAVVISEVRTSPDSTPRSLVETVRAEKVRLYRHPAEIAVESPQPHELAAFANGVAKLLESCSDQHDAPFRSAREAFQLAHFELFTVENKYAVIREAEPFHGWGTFVVNLENPTGMVVEVPSPHEEWATFESGLLLFQELHAGSLAIAGTPRSIDRLEYAETTAVGDTVFGCFHRAMTSGSVLAVRSDLTRTLHRQERPWTPGSTHPRHEDACRLWVKRGLPESFDLRSLDELVGGFQIEWQTTARPDTLRDTVWTGHAELVLTERECGRLLARLAMAGPDHIPFTFTADSETTPAAWLHEQTDLVLDRGSNRYQPPLPEQLYFLDEEVLRPLLPIVFSNHEGDQWTAEEHEQIAAVAAAANVIGYQLQLLTDTHGQAEFLVLNENAARDERRGWGSYVFRMGTAHPTAIEIPRVVKEQWTSEYGLSLFRDLHARSMLLAGAHPETNLDQMADLAVDTNPLTVFNLVRQVLIRELDPQPWRHIQVRAFSSPVDADVIVALADPGSRDAGVFDDVLQQLKKDNLRVREANGAEETAGYECDNQLLAKSLRLARDAKAATLWLAPNLRTQYRMHVDDILQIAEFQAVQIPSETGSIEEILERLAQTQQLQPFDGPFQTIVSDYLTSRNVIELRRLQRLWTDAVWTRIVDRESQQSYLIGRSQGQLLVVYLAELAHGSTNPLRTDRIDHSTIRQFVDSRATWIERRTEP